MNRTLTSEISVVVFALLIGTFPVQASVSARGGWNEVRAPGNGKLYPKLAAGFVEPIASLSLCRKGGDCITPASRGLVIMLGGTGAKPSEYGVLAAMSETASYLVNRNWDVWGLENPMYRNYDRVAEKADPRDIADFGTLDQQLRWLYGTLRFILQKIPRERLKSGYQVTLLSRSTGTGLMAEGLHRFLLGEGGTEVFSELSHVLLQGVVGHLEREIDLWNAVEVAHKSADPVIQPAGVKIFREMSWSTEGASPLLRPGIKAPVIGAIVSKFDDFQPPGVQHSIYRRFFKNHPQLRGKIYGLPTEHNPASNGRYERFDGAIESQQSMFYLGPVIQDLVAHDPGEDARLVFEEHPHNQFYLRLLPKCRTVLGEAGTQSRRK